MRSEILRRRCVRFGLALFEFVVRLDVALWAAAIGADCVAGIDVADVVVLVLVVMRFVVFAGGMFFAVLIVMRFGVSFMLVMLMLARDALRPREIRDARPWPTVSPGKASVTTGADYLRRAVAVRIAVTMAVIVILKIFEYVADVQEGVAIEADIDEGGLHTGEDAGDAAFVDATDECELFFALDINFD